MISVGKMHDREYEAFLEMAGLLWPDWEAAELREEFDDLAVQENLVILIARSESDRPIGFAQVSIRSDYVPGAEESPVAFLEGIYVRDEFRSKGVGRQLLEAAMSWGREKGCAEMGSDALLDNDDSHRFHKRVGFREVERIVTFIRKI